MGKDQNYSKGKKGKGNEKRGKKLIVAPTVNRVASRRQQPHGGQAWPLQACRAKPSHEASTHNNHGRRLSAKQQQPQKGEVRPSQADGFA